MNSPSPAPATPDPAAPSGSATPPKRPRNPARFHAADEQGRLLKARPDDGWLRWSTIAVSLPDARRRIAAYSDREVALLQAVAAHRYLNTRQIALRFYDTPRTAQRYLAALTRDRFVVPLAPPPLWMVTATGARLQNHMPQVYALDYNGYYYLRTLDEPLVHNWDPATILLPPPTAAHQAGLAEIWAWLYQAVRQTYAPGYVGSQWALGWRPETQAHIALSAKEWLRPDAELLFCSRRRAAIVPGWTPSAAPGSHEEVVARRASRESWAWATLGDWPDPAAINTAEEGSPVYFGRVLLEFETGQNSRKDQQARVERYNRLLKLPALIQKHYGRFPRILVVVRDTPQIEPMMQLWRQHYQFPQDLDQCPVLVTSLTHLHNLPPRFTTPHVQAPVWIDALAPGRPRWVPLYHALHMPENIP